MKINLRNTRIEILCHECKQETDKALDYLLKRVRAGKLEFYCSPTCANKAHARKMTGKGNPNFEGSLFIQPSNEWSAEKRARANAKMSETRIREGTFSGENNPRWNGGLKVHECIVCGNPTELRPYISKKVDDGQRKACCSDECVLKLARRSVPNKSTSIEIKMAEELTRRGIEYDDQYNLGDKFRLDFFLPEYNIVIECDGDYWHNLPDVIARDKRKNSYIKACDFSLYRFWEHEINTDVEACVDIVFAEINEKVAI